MSTLILNLPDAQIQRLQLLAKQRGTSVDELVCEVLEELTVRSASEIMRDPLYLMRAHESAAPADLSQQADHYLYGAPKS